MPISTIPMFKDLFKKTDLKKKIILKAQNSIFHEKFSKIMEALNLVCMYCILYIFRKTLFNPMFLLLFPEDENDVSFRLPRLIRRDIVA